MGATIHSLRHRVALDGIQDTQSCSIDWSRNWFLTAALEAGSDWLLMCDADTWHGNMPGRPTVTNPAGDILRMLETGAERQAAVIAAPVRMRGRAGYNVFAAGEAPHIVEPTEWAGRVVEVDRIGTAFMAISCAWIRACWPEQPWFLTQQLPGPKPKKIGEDVNFCDGVRARGGVILADGRYEPNHIG